ncbi:MAG TPA: carboxypeptidase-like regulatory domain-containing protein [Chitinophagales bacterium]|nr:carboxypeptidase-like regulatory domain-containing protein [Chitinophagales bacterium]
MNLFLKRYILIPLLSSCIVRNGAKLSSFTILGKNHNQFIENRVPDYGDGRRDGCVVEGQLSLNLNALKKDSIAGIVFDSKTSEPIAFSTIRLVQENNSTNQVTTDSLGEFHIKLKYKIIEIQIEYIGYRTLNVNLTKLN